MIIVLIEPKWNVKFDFIGAKDGKVIVLIEPKWNVKLTQGLGSLVGKVY